MDIKILGEIHFKSKVIRETIYGVVEDYGEQDNTMRLMRVGNNLMIEWDVGVDYAEIGIWTVGMDVTEYDGVFELPKEAIALLKQCGFNTKEIEDDVKLDLLHRRRNVIV